MSEHKLQPGRTLIDGLLRLGEGLGYYVKPESPVQKGGKNPPAVDVAWMADETQEFPLMIFEVETSAGNSIANNPLKVFGQLTDQFEKPLFFFHVIINSGAETARIATLRNTYGSNNYRLYRLDHDEKAKLLLHILAQHRRLRANIDVLSLRELLKHDAWTGVSPSVMMNHAEILRFHCGYLHAYATLALSESAFINTFVEALILRESQPSDLRQPSGYKTYLGQRLGRLIHISILSRAFPEKKATLFKELRNWQEGASMMPMISPNFGLNREYDEFLACLASGLTGVVCGIFGDHLEARVYLAGIIQTLLQEMQRAGETISFYNATWLLHISATLPDTKFFNFARDFINSKGGISPDCLLNPPFSIPADSDHDPEDFPWNYRLLKKRALVPEISEFRSRQRAKHSARVKKEDAILLGIELLIRQEDFDSLALQALCLLACRPRTKLMSL
jgi:hypothetical protein